MTLRELCEAWAVEHSDDKTLGHHLTVFVRAERRRFAEQMLRRAAMAVHVLRPSEHDPGRFTNPYEAMMVHPHMLNVWVEDRDAVASVLDSIAAAEDEDA